MALIKRKIIFIPGKNPKPEPAQHHELLLRCLLHGVSHQNKDIANSIVKQSAFELCSWNFDFYQTHDDISSQLVWIERLLEKHQANACDKHAASLFRTRFMRLVYQLGDRFPSLIDLLADERVKQMLEGSSQYFDNYDGLASQARATIKNAILESVEQNEKILLIAHSLGSVIAYDALYELMIERPDKVDIDLFFTIGSPLGLAYTQKRLLSYKPKQASSFPNNITHWKNMSACGDLVSIDKTIADDFSTMRSQGLVDSIEDLTDNVVNWYQNTDGYNQHRSYGYLVNPQFSKIIINWWNSHEQT